MFPEGYVKLKNILDEKSVLKSTSIYVFFSLLNDKRVTVFMTSVVTNTLLLTELPISGTPRYLMHYNYLANASG